MKNKHWVQVSARAAILLMVIPLWQAMAEPLDDAVKTYKYLRCRQQGAAFIARFYNPPTNLMNAPMVDEIRDLLKNVEADTQTRALLGCLSLALAAGSDDSSRDRFPATLTSDTSRRPKQRHSKPPQDDQDDTSWAKPTASIY